MADRGPVLTGPSPGAPPDPLAGYEDWPADPELAALEAAQQARWREQGVQPSEADRFDALSG